MHEEAQCQLRRHRGKHAYLASAEDQARVEAQEPHVLAVRLLSFHCRGPQAYPGADVVNEGHILCQDARVWSLLEESATTGNPVNSAQTC